MLGLPSTRQSQHSVNTQLNSRQLAEPIDGLDSAKKGKTVDDPAGNLPYMVILGSTESIETELNRLDWLPTRV
jgi:hypothetical protein